MQRLVIKCNNAGSVDIDVCQLQIASDNACIEDNLLSIEAGEALLVTLVADDNERPAIFIEDERHGG